MKLYLSSFDIGDYPEKLIELTSPGKKAVVILNALDHKAPARKEWLNSQTQTLGNLGFEVEELDLRKYFGKQDELEKLLQNKNLVWINGGNTFILRRAMKQSGFDTVITDLVKRDKIVYAGFSAGCVVLHKDLHGLDITDDPNIVPEEYDTAIPWEGLGLINFSIAVHYQSNHSETELTDKEIEYYKTNNIPYKTLRDGEVIVSIGDTVEVLELKNVK